MSETRQPPREVWGLVALFATSGFLHFARPRPFERIVPRGLPHRRALVHVSGAAELACAAGLVYPPTRRIAGLASAGLLAAVFPANLQMTLDIFRHRSTAAKVVAVARLPLQLPMMRAGWRTWKQLARPAPRSGPVRIRGDFKDPSLRHLRLPDARISGRGR